MEDARAQDWHGLAASTLEWWRDAGIDVLVEETPRDWFAKPERPAARATASGAVASAAPAPPPKPRLPDTINAFLEWRLGDAAPDARWGADRFAPQGPVDADILILTDVPEGDDLLGGAAGTLFDRMLAAIRHDRSSILLAGLCVARPLTGRVPAELIDPLGEIARHYIGLTSAKRVFLLGQSVSRALLGANGAAGGNSLATINHQNGNTLAIASLHPRYLLERPAHKSQAWKDLQLLIGGTPA